ncbi:MAG: DUF3781 domain-containing protein [Tenuifilaceae bacterium]|uniref:DUF3781 domain-containing protein n=1 Tax=Perlabentimonas gracilis TaxID=2715279 RepID=UPI00140CAF31|nr:DUF3781 domain-containing protein [Perlabentimonas gracilis]MDX9771649.1 DUF3781 domain-containing protein [Tenuifilaceae bacterium]NHB69930.1 DUF3781 domain-containing protein [Perlabentimonas gracilis]
MISPKQKIIENLCYTDLVYKRINKKLATDLSNVQIESFIDEILKTTNEKFYIKTGKNYYVTNTGRNVRITINSNTFRVITVDRTTK